jgi:hypothetical protein
MPTRVPKSDSEFDQYIQNTTTYILAGSPTTNGARLGLTPIEIADWTSARDQWIIIYPKYTNTNTRTKTITQQKNLLKADFIEFSQPLLKRIDSSASVDEADRNVFNVPLPDRTPTPRGVINAIPYINLKAIGGGMIEVRVRTQEDGSRASRHPLADGVEVRYKLVAQGGVALPAPGGNNSGGQDLPPVAASECNNSITSGKALFKIDVGQLNSGKIMYCFLRWVNISVSANSGQWSGVMQVLVV